MAVEFNRRPFLSIVVQPQSRFRFRYESEMRGTHGMLIGEGEDSVTKRFPSVKLHQFKGREAIVRVSLATNEDKPIPHVHSLVAEKGQGKDVDFIDVTVSAASDYTAIFQGIAIIHRGKRFVHEVLTNRISKMELQIRSGNAYFPAHEELDQTSLNEIQELVKRKAPGIDPHAVKLKFEAFTFDQYGNLIQIAAPVYSKPIFNEKGAQTGTLKVVKIDKAYSSCRGREEIFIFVEKVSKKNIKIRFFELDPATKQENWHAFADFSENDVHHQYAIAFRTPPFRDLNIEDDVQVFMELYRPQDGARSEPRPFTYKPCENPRKRLRQYNDVNGLNDQLTQIFKSIVGETTFSYDSCAKSVRRGNEVVQSNRIENCSAVPKFTLAPPIASPMTSLSVSPQFSPMGDSYCSSYCGSPSNDMVSPQHPHSEVSSVEASPYTSSDMRFDECTPATFSFDDFTDNGELPDFFDLASGGNGLQYNLGLTDQNYDAFGVLPECSVGTGGPPRLSSNGLASDSACIAASAVQAQNPKQIQQLTNMIGGFNLNDDVTGRPSNQQAPIRHKKSPPESSNTPRSKTKLKQLANIGSVFHTVLSVCNEQKIGAMIKLLVSEGGQAVFDWKNSDGLTALHVALTYRKMVAVEQLVLAGANVNIADKDGDTVLHAVAGDDELTPILEVLLRGRDKDAALCRRNNQGLTPLHLAVEEGSRENIALLLKNGANVNLTEHRRGRTPLHIAVEQNCLPSVKSLIELGKQIDVNIESYNGKTALEITTNEEIKTTLIAAGGHLRENPEQDLSDS